MDIVYYVAASLDGYIAMPDGDVDWLYQFEGNGDDYGFSQLYASIDGIVMGRGTYEFSLAQPEWPAPDMPSWVMTHRDLQIAHPSVTLTSATPAQLVDTLTARGLKSVWLMGGGKVAASFRQSGLISRYIIAIMPIILGEGIPLLAAIPRQDVLTLTEAKTFSSGVVQLSYASTERRAQ